MDNYVEIQEYIRSKTGLGGLELVSMTNLATEHRERSLWFSVPKGWASGDSR